MNEQHFTASRYVLSSCIAAAMLVGCGRSQPPIGAPGAMPQTFALTAHAEHAKSWMKPGTSNGNLLYASNENTVGVFTIPGGEMVGALSGFELPVGLCADKNGDAFVVDEGAAEVFEYAHGGTSPIATLGDSGNGPDGCYVDPKSGNLAVAGGDGFTEDNIAVYAHATGQPTVYKIGAGGYFLYCTYDDQGNIFTNVGDESQEAIYELPKGGSGLTQFPVNETIGPDGGLQWDGKYLDIENAPGTKTNEPIMIYRVKINGEKGTVVGTILLDSAKVKSRDRNPRLGTQFWIQDGMIFSPVKDDGPVGVWRFPSAGRRIRSFDEFGNLLGVTVSLAPSR